MSDKNPDNVVRLPIRKPSDGSKSKIFDMVSDLIAQHATDIDDGAVQHIAGDGNLQFSSDPVVFQSIKGNCNIQISSCDPSLERRLSFLEAYLKKSQRVRDTVCEGRDLKKADVHG